MDGKDGRPFYAVIDGYVVDTGDFIITHPGGYELLLSTNAASTGHTGKSYGLSLSRGDNAHLRHTQQIFNAAVQMFESNGGKDSKEVEVIWPSLGKIVIIGKLRH